MGLWNIIGLVVTVVVFIFVMRRLNAAKPETKKDSTQDIVNFKRITDDGFIELPDGTYRAMIEVEPVNMYLKTPEEQKLTWMQFRNLLNSIHVPMTILVQSRHKDIKGYVSDLRESSKEIVGYEKLQQFGHDLASYLEAEISEKYIKDHRYYIVLEVNPNVRDTEIDIPSESLTNFVTSFQKPLSPDEAEDVARQELMDSMTVIASYLSGMGLSVYRMDKNAILEMSYSAVNRDLAPIADYAGIVHSSSIHTNSLTKEIVDGDQDYLADTEVSDNAR